MDSQLKEQAEDVLAQFGLNMATVVNMLFHQIVREREIPLSLSLNRRAGDELRLAKADRLAGYTGRMAENVADEMERILAETEHGAEKI
jgi:addiction module RelB/DinJ family antitoxin